MRRQGNHVDVDTLALAAFTTGTDDAGIPTDVRAHLHTCADCAARLASIERSLAEARGAVDRQADAVFTDRRLAHQHAAIMRRLDPDAARARLLAFPVMSSGARPAKMVARRWVAAAAIVGLVSGVAAGRFLGGHESRTRTILPGAYDTIPRLSAPVESRSAAYEPADDEQFLVELDAALGMPRIEPLRAIDALTPRAGDFAAPPR